MVSPMYQSSFFANRRSYMGVFVSVQEFNFYRLAPVGCNQAGSKSCLRFKPVFRLSLQLLSRFVIVIKLIESLHFLSGSVRAISVGVARQSFSSVP